MCRRWLLFLVCLGCTLPFLGQVSNARFEIKVDERATRVYFRELSPEVSLVVVNGAQTTQRARIRLELLDPHNQATATVDRRIDLKSGSQKLPFTLPTKTRDLTPDTNSQVLWYRLHYRIDSDNSDGQKTNTEGFISLSEITPDLFKLQVIGPPYMVPGKTYAPRVRATHPLTHAPFKNVSIKGVVSGYDTNRDDITLTSSAITNADGFADLKFDLPASHDEDFDITIEGTLGLITVKADREVDVYNEPTLIVSTDKPIYQPGQTVHARILLLGPSKRVLANQTLTLAIEDPEDTVVANSVLTTSRFGIASAEWTIPENTRLGDYELEFEMEDQDFSRTAVVKVSRYELPTFTVNAKPDRPYYQAGQNATVEISANYLFGKPVSRGHVRLVRETERNWNSEEQKYDTVEGDQYEGDTQPDGVFKAQIDLSKDHEELKDEDYNRFTDLPYVAYFTDPTTNRTERRQLNLRLTKDAIHIYVVRANDAYYEYRNLPFDFYLSTFYADGSPAQANVTVRAQSANSSKVLRQLKTNRYGVAKISQFQLPNDAELSSFDLQFDVRDADGKTGKQTDTVAIDDEHPAIKVTTKKTLLAVNEPIEVTITATKDKLPVTVTVSRDGGILKTKQLRLRNGRADLVLPYQPEFKDELVINAFGTALDQDDEEQLIWGSHTVLYPRKRDLNVNLESLKGTYAPGEQAHVSFRTASSEGRGIETALGVVITDKSVDERVRSDEGPTSRYTSFTNWISAGNSLGSITRKSLDEIDTNKPVPADLQLVAEVLLNQGRGVNPIMFDDGDYSTNQASVFETLIEKAINPLAQGLTRIYDNSKQFPKDDSSLQELLRTVGLDFSSYRDPWGMPYRSNFFIGRESQFLSIECSGADKQFDTTDDFSVRQFKWPYFRVLGDAINTAVNEHHQRTGAFIRDLETLRSELRTKNIDLDALRDPWNQPYKFLFKVNGTYLQIEVVTRAPGASANEEFSVWESSIDYFFQSRIKLDSILAERLKGTGTFPVNEKQLETALIDGGINPATLRDPWGRPYYFIFQTDAFYGDDVRIENRRRMDQSDRIEQVVVKPVTKSSTVIRIRSNGLDSKKGTSDDFEVGYFTGIFSVQSAADQRPQPVRPQVSLSGSTGAITGTITDPMGAVVRGATVTAKAQNTDQVFEGTTDENGKFFIRNIPSGVYEIRASSPGFKDSVISHVIIRSSELVKLELSLDVGTVAETVTVSSTAVSVMQTSTAVVSSRKNNLISLTPELTTSKQQLFTPRVREYFPETLLWQPQLTTDKKGRAQLDFKLADNITTWRMSVIGSTEDGEIGTAETEIRAFQPFFAELDPPRILTEGDRISLPVVLRNYLAKRQSVDLTLRPESWFKVLESNQRKSEVAAGDSKNEDFDLQTIASIRDGKQRVTAIGSEFSDAIEKPVSVHPDGEEKAETYSEILASSTSLNINVPANAVPNSIRADVKVYPNLMAHVWESVEGIMQRPYGCGEQTISSTYPSVMVLRYLNSEKIDSPVALKAKRYVEEGYQRLLGYQSGGGGFGYWGNSGPDIALTAYALRFLHDASQVTTVNKSVSERAQQWLLSQQRPDGSWSATPDKLADPRGSAMLTALVARSLALSEIPSNTSTQSSSKTALVKALDFLASRIESVDEPYLIASYSLASRLSGETARASKANARLLSLAHTEGSRTYWSLETNTPFYGWGLAGRIESTALAVQALAVQGSNADQKQTSLQSRGLLFLIFNKDRYGVWYSTQATINVLEAILASLKDQTSTAGGPGSIELQVNGKPTRNIPLPTDVRMVAPITMDLSSDLQPGTNTVTFNRSGGGSPVSLQVVNTYYVPWQTRADLAHVRASDSEALRLETTFDKFDAKVTEAITCRVKAERIGFRGYGMLLAEIGLPPGADVDRSSLDEEVKNSDWSINHYDVLPDRVVVYLWPRAGGSEFSFKFRPRIAMTAKAAPSIIYDYYNPEAKAVVAPSTFVVR